jgi:hypothetical protein
MTRRHVPATVWAVTLAVGLALAAFNVLTKGDRLAFLFAGYVIGASVTGLLYTPTARFAERVLAERLR